MIRTENHPPPRDVLSFRATNVTGTRELPVEFGRELSAGDVTDVLVDRMSLPEDVSWVLRDDQSSAFLDESRPIGDQLEPGAHVTVTPMTHLGGWR
jgi:hypothetical protein